MKIFNKIKLHIKKINLIVFFIFSHLFTENIQAMMSSIDFCQIRYNSSKNISTNMQIKNKQKTKVSNTDFILLCF